MTRVLTWILLVALLGGGGWFVGIRHRGDVQAASAEARTEALAAYRRVRPETKAAAAAPTPLPRIPVVTVAAESADLPITRAAVGWIEPIASVMLRARTDGQITEQLVRDGQTVKEGEVLFRLDDREARAQLTRDEAALTKDQATLAKTLGDVRRVQELLARNSASQQQFDLVTADSKVAAANVAADQAAIEAGRVRLDFTTIRAPISGRVGTVRVTAGNLVKGNDSAGEGLVTITQMKPLRVSFALPERDLDLLRAAMRQDRPAAVRVFSSGTETALAGGTLFFVDSAVDQTSGTVTARAQFPNDDDRLWPGQYVRVEIDLSVRPNTTTIPLVAVQPGQDGSYVFVVRENKTVERRRIEVLEARGQVAALQSGIAAGERVVVEGQLRLRNGSPIAETTVGPERARQARTARAD